MGGNAGNALAGSTNNQAGYESQDGRGAATRESFAVQTPPPPWPLRRRLFVDFNRFLRQKKLTDPIHFTRAGIVAGTMSYFTASPRVPGFEPILSGVYA